MTPAEHIEQTITNLNDWRGKTYVELRELINTTAPDLTEDWKWNCAVWSGNKLVCALSVHKQHVKINFFHGAKLKDPDGIINNGMDSKDHRAIDFFENDVIDADKVARLLREAVAIDA